MTIQVRISISLMLSLVLTWNGAGWAQGTEAENLNLAAAKNGGRIVYVSSYEDETWRAENLIDGEIYNPKTEKGSKGWASKGPWELVEPGLNPPPDRLGVGRKSEEVIIGFKDDQIKSIGRIVINPLTYDPLFTNRSVRLFEVQVSTQTKDGPWRSIGRAEVPQKPDSVTGSYNFSYNIIPAVQARYVRIIFLANWNSDQHVSCGEIEIYAQGVESTLVSPGTLPNTFAPAGGASPYTVGGPFSAADLVKFLMDMKPEDRLRFIEDLERLIRALKGGAGTSNPPTTAEKK
ncbi:MAG: discoidin domain-containing protein [Abditibacteriales bacterium]|nr:discoidin domain-containing protein [Abditibacteriales bacterium]MDW8368144.1 discoidin domain-containing protein [Abditibacteriales bacterium]